MTGPVKIQRPVGDNSPTATLYYGADCRDSLRLLPEQSVHCVVTSPPYWGLRDYGTGNNQIGLEASLDEFVGELVEVFREVRRVLRDDGTLWINLGDSYASAGMGSGLKAKDLIGVPWRVALALQADGWYLRNEIIYSKPNPMPESVKDRLTRSHEHVFLFAHPESGGSYFYDQDAIREPLKASSKNRNKYEWNNRQRTHDPKEIRSARHTVSGAMFEEAKGSNKRTVWEVSPKPYPGAHFAVFPPKLIEPCILAGCPKGGTVLDPFSGSGTTGQVAMDHQRNYVGLDLNADYLELAEARILGERPPLKADESKEKPSILGFFGVQER